MSLATKQVMDQKFKDSGEMEGRELLHMLAMRPATAQFISRKLAIRFVADEPPQSLVDRMAKTYLSSDGDMTAVLKTLFHSPEFWSTSTYRAKVKTPLEFVALAGCVLQQRELSITCCRLKTIFARWACQPTAPFHPPVTNGDAAGLGKHRRAGRPHELCAEPGGGPARLALRCGWSPFPGQNAQTGQVSNDPSPEAEETRLESLLIPGGVSDTTRTAALQQFAAQSAQNAATPISAPMRPNRAPNFLEREDQVLAGLLIGSPEFQRR